MSSPIALPLDWLRSLQVATMPDLCSVSRYTETNGPDGVTADWSTVAADVPCRVSVTSTSATEATGGAEQMRAVSDWQIRVPFGTDVTPRDRVVVAATPSSPERTFEVRRADIRSFETVRDLQCSEVI